MVEEVEESPGVTEAVRIGVDVVLTLLEVAGTLNVTFSGTTTSGAAITGAAQIVVTTTVSASGTTTVDVTLTPV